MMVGDFNAYVGNDKEGIKENLEKIGVNGKEYRRLIKDNKLILVNNTEKCKGKWTREYKNTKSILDLTITTEPVYHNITEMIIDEEDKYEIESKKSKTDHKMTIIKINMLINKDKHKIKTVRINNGKWEEYKVKLKGERTSKKNLVLNESKYDEGDLCEI